MQCTKKTLLFKDQNEVREYDRELDDGEIFFTPVLKPKKSRKEILESPINLYKTGEGENIFYNSDEESGPHLKMKVYDQMDINTVVRNTKRVKTIKLVKENTEEPVQNVKPNQIKDDESPFRFKYTVDQPSWDWKEDKNISILGYMSSKGEKFLVPNEGLDN